MRDRFPSKCTNSLTVKSRAFLNKSMTCRKMEVLKLNQMIFQYVGISLDARATRNECIRSAAVNIFMLAAYSVVIGCSTTYIWTHLNEVENSIFSTMQFVAYGAIFGTYVSLAWKKADIREYFKNTQDFVLKSTYIVRLTHVFYLSNREKSLRSLVHRETAKYGFVCLRNR